ncbi:MAG: hypothetical protein KAH01_02970, partial [Caldisericia bacterium]|nr:hypothetical protein [Caldisericia bacterium]
MIPRILKNKILWMAITVCLVVGFVSCQKTKPVSINDTHEESVIIAEITKESEVVDDYVIDPDQMAETIEWINPIPYRIKSIHAEKSVYFEGTNFFTYESSYPYFSSLPDKVVQGKVNIIIKNYVDKELDEFWDSAEG